MSKTNGHTGAGIRDGGCYVNIALVQASEAVSQVVANLIDVNVFGSAVAVELSAQDCVVEQSVLAEL